MSKKKSDEVSIGKLDILATYASKVLLDGECVLEAKEGGMIAAIMGAKVRMGHYSTHRGEE